MSYVIVGEPGSKYGPCVEECGHLDCRAARIQASCVCQICGEQIGFATKWTRVDYQGVGKWEAVHLLCLMKREETIQNQRRRLSEVFLKRACAEPE